MFILKIPNSKSSDSIAAIKNSTKLIRGVKPTYYLAFSRIYFAFEISLDLTSISKQALVKNKSFSDSYPSLATSLRHSNILTSFLDLK